MACDKGRDAEQFMQTIPYCPSGVEPFDGIPSCISWEGATYDAETDDRLSKLEKSAKCGIALTLAELQDAILKDTTDVSYSKAVEALAPNFLSTYKITVRYDPTLPYMRRLTLSHLVKSERIEFQYEVNLPTSQIFLRSSSISTPE